MVGEGLQQALTALKSERARLDEAIRTMEKLVTRQVAQERKGPRSKAAKSPARKTAKKRKNAPRGLLKKMIVDALKAAKKPMAPVKLRDAVIAAGYPAKNAKTLYTSVFNTAKAHPKVKKTAAGFSLK
jgi:hypothetical protein